MIEFKQCPDKVDEILRLIGNGKPREGCRIMAAHTGLGFHSVLHWIEMSHIPTCRFDDVQAVCDQMGIDWSPDDLDDKRIAMRKCLTCSGMFVSEHVGNRICSRCSTYQDVKEGDYGEPYRVVGR